MIRISPSLLSVRRLSPFLKPAVSTSFFGRYIRLMVLPLARFIVWSVAMFSSLLRRLFVGGIRLVVVSIRACVCYRVGCSTRGFDGFVMRWHFGGCVLFCRRFGFGRTPYITLSIYWYLNLPVTKTKYIPTKK